jgi:ABC-2 type transport system permease protein
MQNPGSVVSRILSFFPPTTPFVMVMRLSQPSHIVPMWERFATMGAGILGVAIAFWAAAKVFRVGILMYGKPPTLMTLWKWIRYA